MPATPRAYTVLPTGTVTFLFTDIEGSTTLWEQFPIAMRGALAQHDTLLRHTIGSHGGCIVKTTGDGVVAAFSEAADALAACLSAQRALQAPQAGASNPELATTKASGPISLRVRMGV